MTNASTQRPEERYETIKIPEAAGFPSPGERRYADDGSYLGRGFGFIPYGKELLGRDYLFVHHNDETTHIPAADRIMGTLSRETPTGTMASVFARFLDWAHNLALPDSERDPNSAPQNLMFVLSGPGIGKTHLPKVMSKAFGYAHELIGSGEAGGDIDELVIAHEFKGNSVSDIFSKIEIALSLPDDERNKQSLATKQTLINELRKVGFLEEAAVNGVKVPRLNMDAVMLLKEKSKDITKEELADLDEKAGKNIALIWEIARKSHLDVKDASEGIGIQKVNGRLLNCLIKVKDQYERSLEQYGVGKAEPVMITLDEFNRFRSFGKKLQNFWEVVGGASKEPVTLVDAAGKSHTFTPEMLRYVFIYMTGNDPNKMRGGARELDYSMLDRIGENRVFRLDDFSAADWQHRLEQQLMGIGIDIHYRAGASRDGTNYWDQHPDQFTQHLLSKREQGATPGEKLQFSAMQKEMLGNWDKIHQGTGQVAQFFAEQVKICAKHRGELEKMASVPEISPRLINHLINDMRSASAGSASFMENMAAMLSGKSVKQPRLSALNLGTMLCAMLKDQVDKTYTNKDSKVRWELYLSMYRNGIISAEVYEDYLKKTGHDANEMHKTTKPDLVEDLLNTDPNRHYDKELKPLQAAVAEAIRQRHPDQREKSDDELITLKELSEAVKLAQTREAEMAEKGRPSDMPAVFRRVLLPSISINETGHTKIEFIPSTLVDRHMQEEQIEAGRRETLLKTVSAKRNQWGSMATTSETLLGLALATNTPQQIQEMINPEVGKAYYRANEGATLGIFAQTAADATAENATSSRSIHERAKRRHAQSIAQLDPAFKGKPEISEALTDMSQLLTNTHPSGLSVSVMRTVGYDESNPAEQRYFSDTLSIITLTQPDPENKDASRSDLLVVGFTPISEGLKSYLHDKRHITYVCAKEPNAQATVLTTLKGLVGTGKAQLAKADASHQDLEETEKAGLVFHLQQAANGRLTDSFDGYDAVPPADAYEDRITKLAANLIHPNNILSTSTYPQFVTGLSWADMIANEEKAPDSGRAA